MRLKRSTVSVLLLAATSLAAGEYVFAGRLPSAVSLLSAAVAPAKPADSTKLKVPFRVGEKLVYEVGYMSMPQAATAELKVMPRLDFYGHASWHFQATAHSEDPLRYVLVLDDQFDSYASASTLVTRQYELYLNEQGKKSARKLSLNSRTPGSEMISAPAGTRDPLAMFYGLRSNDWKSRPEMLSPVYDGTHFYQMMARIAARHDSVTVPAGTFDTSRISVSVSSRESATTMQFTLWLANNAARTPVEVDADVPIGTVKGLLLRIEK
jgi:hypothetical protein